MLGGVGDLRADAHHLASTLGRQEVSALSLCQGDHRALPILAVTIPNADDVSCGLDHTQDSSSVDNAGYISIVWQHDPADLDGGWGLGCRARLAGGGGQVAEGEHRCGAGLAPRE